MAYSYVVYTGNGSTTQFTVTFPYIRREHVNVSVNYVTTAFTWVNNTTIQISPAPASAARVEVRRVTPVTAPLVDFTDGSTLVAADLDTNALQQTYINQEQDDQFKDAIFTNTQGLLDAGAQRITNVGNPVNAQDAATKTYVDNFVSQTANIANSAVTTAKIADGSVTDAKLASGIDGAKLTAGSVPNTALADADLQTLAGAQAGAAAAFAALTATEVATLDGLTASTAELNLLDGVTADTTEINKLDGLLTSTSELNQLSGKTISGTLTPGNTNDIPTSSAVNSWVANLVNALGGFVAIPNRTSFPTTNPDPSDDAGTVVSIADAGGLIVSAGGVATNAQTTGASAVTITGFPAAFQSKTLPAGTGIQVQTTSTLNTYTYHKAIPTDADIAQLNDDINDFFARYRIGSVNPTINLDSGDLFFNTSLGKMLVYNGISSAWEEVKSFGNFHINTLSSSAGTGGGSASFNGTAYRFTLSNPPSFAQQLLVSINGVIQKPNSGTTQPAEGFAVDQADIIFSQAPASGSPFFIVTIGTTVDIGAPSDGTVTPAKLSTGGPSWTVGGALSAASLIPTGSTAPTNGVYLPAANSVAISTNGSQRFTVLSDGKVGIGTGSPGSALQVNGTGGIRVNEDGAGTNQIQLRSDWAGQGPAINVQTNQSLLFTTNATERVRIDSSGRVGIGTNSPQAPFVVSNGGAQGIEAGWSGGSSSNYIQSYNRSTSAFGQLDLLGTPLVFKNGATEAARIDSSSRLLVGTSSSSSTSLLVVQGYAGVSSGSGEISITRGGTPSAVDQGLGVIRFQNNNGNTGAQIEAVSDGSWTAGSNHRSKLVFSVCRNGQASPTEALRISNAGVHAITSSTMVLDATGTVTNNELVVLNNTNTGTTTRFSFRSNGLERGSITWTDSATAFNTTSDYRLKDNIAPVADGINRLKQLKPCRFNFIIEPDRVVDGFIAHEVQDVVPEAINGEKDAVDDEGNPKYQGIDQSKLVPLLTAALQEAIGRIESLEAEVAALKAA